MPHSHLTQKEKIVDVWSFFLTCWIALMVGVISAVAIILLFPTLSLIPFLLIFTGFAFAGSLTEGFVYHKYVKNFFRCLFCDGIFGSIDEALVEREAQKQVEKFEPNADKIQGSDNKDECERKEKAKRKKIEDAKEQCREDFLENHTTERKIKKILAILTFFPAIIAGAGFAALTFSHILTLFTLMGLSSGLVTVICPWLMAVAAGVIFSFIIYEMLHRAIRKDVHHKIKNIFTVLFIPQDAWKDMGHKAQIIHVAKTIGKACCILLLLGIAVAATLYTQTEWFESATVFLQTGLNFSAFITQKISFGITLTMVVTGCWFSIENSFKTANLFFSLTWAEIKTSFAEIKNDPKKIIFSIINGLAFVVHVGGNGAVAMQGAQFTSGHSFHAILSGLAGPVNEAAVDAHAVIGKKHKHSHHDIAGTIDKWLKKLWKRWRNLKIPSIQNVAPINHDKSTLRENAEENIVSVNQTENTAEENVEQSLLPPNQISLSTVNHQSNEPEAPKQLMKQRSTNNVDTQADSTVATNNMESSQRRNSADLEVIGYNANGSPILGLDASSPRRHSDSNIGTHWNSSLWSSSSGFLGGKKPQLPPNNSLDLYSEDEDEINSNDSDYLSEKEEQEEINIPPHSSLSNQNSNFIAST